VCSSDLNAHLWTFDPASFLPHGSARDGNGADQPIYLTAAYENPNGAKLLLLCDGAPAPSVEDIDAQGFSLVCALFDGQDDEALTTARAHWRDYKNAQQQLVYYQQDEGGGWVEKVRQ
jgi:DNA polymerase-3 subunit chi